ncbi:hypothetical protein CDD80_5235 [Ophiocordyceps camponoti-rufipedis]|uniref:Uncharacterized protein n=1 Tax=Ophiocordyceps camponoti-rufipedis TaxID=2004952 RepID=A0A2C5YVE8_9HYPO|nr:hypothetical protein CDD80_5235 [Ophiocordyceps camponoti-rufipedis]
MKAATASVLVFAAGAMAELCSPGTPYCGSTLLALGEENAPIMERAYERKFGSKAKASDMEDIFFFCSTMNVGTKERRGKMVQPDALG